MNYRVHLPIELNSLVALPFALKCRPCAKMKQGSCIILMLLVANFAKTKYCRNVLFLITEILTDGHSSASTKRERSNEYQHDRFRWLLKIFVLWEKVASALEGLSMENVVVNRAVLNDPRLDGDIISLF